MLTLEQMHQWWNDKTNQSQQLSSQSPSGGGNTVSTSTSLSPTSDGTSPIKMKTTLSDEKRALVGHTFFMANEKGELIYCVMTEDGRGVPVEDFYAD